MNLRTIRRGASALALLLIPGLAMAQGVPMYQSGTVTPNHLLKSAGNGFMMDVAAPNTTGLTGDANGRGVSPFAITDALGLGLCSNSAVSGGQHYAFCLGHDSTGNALLSLTANGGAVEKSLFLSKNGTLYEMPFVGAGGGNVVGPASSTVDHVAVWNNTSGTLLKDVTSLGLTALTVAGSPTTLTITPTNQIASQVSHITTASGTVATTPTDTNQMALFWMKQTGNLAGVGLNRSVGVAEFDYNDTGTTNNNDSFTGVTGNCNLLNARTGNSKQTACIGVVGAVRGFATQGGGVGTEQGQLHGMNIISGLSTALGTTPTNYYDIIGAESNITGCTGCTMKVRIGFNSIDFGNGGSGDSEQGTTIDAAYAIASVAGTKGWKHGIDFAGGPVYGGNAISGTGTLLGSSAASPTVAAQGIDLNNFSISGNAFRGPNGLFVVSGAGVVAAQTITAQAGFISNAATGTGAVIDFADTNTVRWRAGRQATTNDFIVQDVANGDINMRITVAGATSIGSTNPITISEPGVLNVPGGMTGTTVSTTGAHTAMNATAIPAGGTAGSGYKFSSVANFGVFFGSGAPTLAAAQGSIYLRSDGSSTSTRVYVNSDGGTTWVAVTTAS